MSRRSRFALLALFALSPLMAAPVSGRASEVPGRASDAPVDPAPLYELPAAGSYSLPPIDRVSEHVLLGSDGREAPLLGLGAGRFAIVAFVYLGCHDAAGCPLLLASLQQTDRRLAATPDLRERVRLVTVSFDPSRDGPAEMANLRRALAPRGDWRFFTSRDDATLRPVLADFGQDAVRELVRDGAGESALRHVAKVFLVDGEGRIRNVYGSGFLDASLLMRDLETLLGEHSPAR